MIITNQQNPRKKIQQLFPMNMKNNQKMFYQS